MSTTLRQVQNIKVVARFRPITTKEKQEKSSYKLSYDFDEDHTIRVSTDNQSIGNNSFVLDKVFKNDAKQEEVFDDVCKPIIKDVVKGYNLSFLSYGQTGAGKTYTLTGLVDKEESHGLIPRTAKEIFDFIRNGDENVEYKIGCSFFEIYNEKINDLFDMEKRDLTIIESPHRGLYVYKLTEEYVTNEEEMLEVIKIGSNNRQIISTRLNQDPSYSNSIFIIKVEGLSHEGTTTIGQLAFVDLAGSEKRTETSDDNKNKGLSIATLVKCVDSILEKNTEVPLHESKLTRILRETLGGNTKTTLICNISPTPLCARETVESLQFGSRMKSIKCTAKQNLYKSPTELMQIIKKLEEQIVSLNSNTSDDIESVPLAELKVKMEELECKYKEELSASKQIIKELTTDNNNLKISIKKLREANEKKEDELDIAKEEKESSEKQKEDVRNEYKFKNDELILEVKSLKDQIEDEEKKRFELMKELENAKEEAKHNSIQLIEMAQNISDSEARAKTISSIESLTESNKLYRKLNAQLNERIFDLECKYEDQKRNTASVEAELGSVEEYNKREISRLEKENKKLSQKIKKLEKEIFNLEDECVDIETELNEYLGQLDAVEDTVDELKDKVKKLEKEKLCLEEEIVILKTQVKKAELVKKGSTEIDEDLEDFIIDEYTTKVKKIKDSANAVESKKDKLIEKLKAQLKEEKKNSATIEKDLNKKLDRAEDDLDAEKDKTDELEGQVADFEEDTDKLKDEIKQLKKDVKALEELMEDKSDSYEKIKEEYEEQIKSKEKDLNQLTLQKENLKQELAELQANMEKGAAKQSTLTSQQEQQKLGRNWANDLFELRNRLEKIQDEKEKLQTEANHSRQQIQSERSKLQSANKKIELQYNRIIELQNELDTLRAQKSATQEEKEKQKQKKQVLVDEIERLKQALSSSEQIIQQQKKKKSVAFKPIKAVSSTNELSKVFEQRAKKEK